MAQRFLTSINLSSNELQNALLHPLATAPAVGLAGKVYYNTTEDVLYISDGTVWRSVSGDITSIIAGTGIDVSGATGDVTVTLADTAVTPGTYGSATEIPTFTVDQQGRITSAGQVSVATDLSISDGVNTDTVSLLTDTLSIVGTTNETEVAVTDNTVTIGLPEDVVIGNSLEVGSSTTSTSPVISSTTSSTAANVLLTSTSTSTSSSPDLVLYKDKHPYVDNETLGVLAFRGNDVNNLNAFEYNAIYSKIVDASQQQSALTLNAFYGSSTSTVIGLHNLSDSVSGGAMIVNPGANQLLTPTATLDVRGDANITSNLFVGGDLTVSGTTTTVNTETINLADNIITLNSNATGSASENAGIEVERGDDINVSLVWDETNDRWTFTNDGSTFYNIPLPTEYDNFSFSVSDGTVTQEVGDGGVVTFANGGGLDVSVSGDDIVTYSHADTSSATSVSTSGLNVVQTVSIDTYGHVTDVSATDITPDIDSRIASRDYAASIGDGVTTSYTVTHNLNSKDVVVQLYDNSTFDTVYADVVRDTANTIIISFAIAPSANDIRVLVTKIG